MTVAREPEPGGHLAQGRPVPDQLERGPGAELQAVVMKRAARDAAEGAAKMKRGGPNAGGEPAHGEARERIAGHHLARMFDEVARA